MNKQTYSFTLTSGVIPGIPSDQPDGQFHAGLLVDVDLDEMIVLSTRLVNTMTGETAASKGLIDLSTGEEPLLTSFMSEEIPSKEEIIVEKSKQDDDQQQQTQKLKKSDPSSKDK